jgi:hypothetical protein
MTDREQEWDASEDPVAMVEVLQALPGYPVSKRKLRLWCGALFRISAHPYRGKDVEAWDKGEAFMGEGDTDLTGVCHMWATGECDNPGDPPMTLRAALLRCIVGNPFRPQTCLAGHPVYGLGGQPEHCAYALAIRQANGGLVLRLAEAAYSERQADGSLDNARLAVLADALLDAGCPETQACPSCREPEELWRCRRCRALLKRDQCASRRGLLECGACLSAGFVDLLEPWRPACATCEGTGRVPNPLLAHLRLDGPHVRGCWALDRVLGRE